MRKIIMFGITLILLSSCTKDTLDEFCVTDKDIKRYSEQSDKYLIFTDNGTYEITDSFWNWRWNSSDLYGKIEEGKCYKSEIDSLSWRVPILSMYKNIISIEEIE